MKKLFPGHFCINHIFLWYD